MAELLLAIGLEGLYRQLMPMTLQQGLPLGRGKFLTRPMQCVALPRCVVAAAGADPNGICLIVQVQRQDGSGAPNGPIKVFRQ